MFSPFAGNSPALSPDTSPDLVFGEEGVFGSPFEFLESSGAFPLINKVYRLVPPYPRLHQPTKSVVFRLIQMDEGLLLEPSQRY